MRGSNDRFIGKVHFVPNIPEKFAGLKDLALNLWWTWNPRARELFRRIDLDTWVSGRGNATRFLRNVSQQALDNAAKDKSVVAFYNEVYGAFSDYMAGKSTWWQKNYGKEKALIAYFSSEYGLHENLAFYSGGLGVLSGDHCKSASDLGLPMVAVGLLYREGYFQQHVDAQGQQVPIYERQRWEDLPLEDLRIDGKEVIINVEMPGRTLYAKVWKVHVGRIPILMLDTDTPENSEADRALTARLYGGDTEMRIQQEILLGMGGVRALRALGLKPTVYHMNEGHAAFLSLERLRELMTAELLSLREAREVIRASSLFTTHTPVPAGHDRFAISLIDKYFRTYYESLGINRAEFMDFGLEPMPDGNQLFSMTILALHFASMANGVSELHGEVSKKMMAPIWRDVPPAEIPIDYITNGVHTRTWMSFDMQNLFDRTYGPKWRERITDPAMWEEALATISDEDLWNTKREMKVAMLKDIHNRLRIQHRRHGELPAQLEELESILSPDVLTIGFARRFATYKRATLIFRDPDRLARLVNDKDRPVQFVFAGKAHPQDRPGQEFIRKIIEFSKRPEFHLRLVFLENYDMNIGRRLTSGVDVWLNNPRRPLEASGTSGMKVPLNAGLNCSILDGWWPEAYQHSPEIGWAIGQPKNYTSEEQQDAEDGDSLYSLLEKEIIPLYYNRDAKGIAKGWVSRVRESFKVVAPNFSCDRMVKEYSEKFYLKGSERHGELVAKNFAEAREYSRKKAELRRAWGQIRLAARVVKPEQDVDSDMYSVRVKDKVEIRAEVALGQLSPKDVIVEIYAETLNNPNGNLPQTTRVPMALEAESDRDGAKHYFYTGAFTTAESGEHAFTVRVVPNDPKAFHPMESGLVRWPIG